MSRSHGVLNRHLLAHLIHQTTPLMVKHHRGETSDLQVVLPMLHRHEHIVNQNNSLFFVFNRTYPTNRTELVLGCRNLWLHNNLLLDWMYVYSMVLIWNHVHKISPSDECFRQPLIRISVLQEALADPFSDVLDRTTSFVYSTLYTLWLLLWYYLWLFSFLAKNLLLRANSLRLWTTFVPFERVFKLSVILFPIWI